MLLGGEGIRIEGDKASGYWIDRRPVLDAKEAQKRVATSYLSRYFPMHFRRINGSWRIACNVGRERTGVDLVPEPAADGDDPSRLEFSEILNEEFRRLPSRYSAPLILCYLEGLTYEEASRQLGCPVATVKGRLSRARDLLRTRLARRGLAPSDALMASTISRGLLEIPEPLIDATLRAVGSFLGGRLAGPTTFTTSAALAEGLLMSMRLKRAGIALGLIALGLTTVTLVGLAPVLATGTPAKPGQVGGSPSVEVQPPKSSVNRREPGPIRVIGHRDDETDRRNEAILSRLSTPVTAQFPNEVILREFLQFIRSQTQGEDLPNGIPIYVDPIGLQEAERTLDATISNIELENIPLHVIIRIGLEQIGLKPCIKDGILVVMSSESTSTDDALNPLTELKEKASRGELTQAEVNELTGLLETQAKLLKLELEIERLKSAKMAAPSAVMRDRSNQQPEDQGQQNR